jgi:NADP-dependent 3-hydroxy acid dehydrogenase YdfG
MSKIAFITGATSGFGRAAARRFVEAGWRVVATGRRAERLSALQDELGAALHPAAFDVRDESAMHAALDALPEAFRGIDLLVNNAGLATPGSLLTAGPDELQRQLDVNVTAVLHLTRAVLPGMIDRGRGAVVNVSSIAGFLPGRSPSYGADKAWVTSFTEGVAASLRGTRVRAMALCPGYVRTEFHERAGIDVGARRGPFWLEPARVVDDCLADLARGRVISVPSRQYRAIAVAADLLPRTLVRRLVGLAGRGRQAEP